MNSFLTKFHSIPVEEKKILTKKKLWAFAGDDMSKKIMITFHETAPRKERRKITNKEIPPKNKKYFSGQKKRPLFESRMEHEMYVVLCGDPSIVIKEFKLIIFFVLISSFFS